MIYTILYILFVIVANITANNVLSLWFIQTTVGTLFFGVIFTLRDYIHAKYGKVYTQRLIIITTILNIICVLFGAFDIRIIIASAVAFFVSEMVDTNIYHAIAKKYSTLRAIGISNAVSIPIDTILFNVIAFYGIWTIPLIGAVTLGDVVVKYIVSSVIIFTRKFKLNVD